MKYRSVWVMGIIAIGILGTLNAAAQSFHQLAIDDFAGVPRENSRGVIAYTNCTIDFRYEATRKNGYYSLDFNIRLILNNNKSWMDKGRVKSREMLAEILKHEQGHYTIAYLEQQELLRQVGRTRFGANYQAEAMNIFNHIDAKYKQLNYDYDEDTQHMINRTQQSSWDAYFKKRLEYMPDE
jgi:hypothetical protein